MQLDAGVGGPFSKFIKICIHKKLWRFIILELSPTISVIISEEQKLRRFWFHRIPKPVCIEQLLWSTVYSGQPWVASVTLSRHILIWHHIVCLMSIFIDLVCVAVEKDHRRRSWRRCGWLRKPEMDLPGPANGSKTKMFRFWAIQESHNNQVRLRFKTFQNKWAQSQWHGRMWSQDFIPRYYFLSWPNFYKMNFDQKKLKISSKFCIGALSPRIRLSARFKIG